MSTDTWQAFGIPDEAYAEAADGRGQKILNITWRRPKSARKAAQAAREAGDSSRTWLRSALVGLGVLAGAAAAVSFAAQYQLVYAAKEIRWASVLEAGIPDVGSMVFATLGIALALKGKLALRARGGNLACVGLSLVMNLIAATGGWHGVAIWVMPSAVYAFASDTLIGVIRAHALASQGRADNEKTALAALGAVLLWLLRLVLAARSTCKGFRQWVVECSPVAPGVTPAAVTAANESAARAIEAAQATAGQQVTEAERARDEAASRAQVAGQQAAAAQAAAESAQAELRRAREDFAAGRDQLREDFARQQDEYRASLAGMRQTAQALDEEYRKIARERDSLRTELATLRATQQAAKPPAKTIRAAGSASRGPSKTSRFLDLVKDRYGDLAGIDPSKVSKISAELAPEVGLDPGAARAALRPLVVAARGGAR